MHQLSSSHLSSQSTLPAALAEQEWTDVTVCHISLWARITRITTLLVGNLQEIEKLCRLKVSRFGRACKSSRRHRVPRWQRT